MMIAHASDPVDSFAFISIDSAVGRVRFAHAVHSFQLRIKFTDDVEYCSSSYFWCMLKFFVTFLRTLARSFN